MMAEEAIMSRSIALAILELRVVMYLEGPDRPALMSVTEPSVYLGPRQRLTSFLQLDDVCIFFGGERGPFY